VVGDGAVSMLRRTRGSQGSAREGDDHVLRL